MQDNSDLRMLPERYSICYRKIKYPRLEFKTGNLVLVLPKEYQKGNKLLEKHDKWIATKMAEIQEAFKLASRLKLNKSRSDEDFKEIVNSAKKKDERELRVHVNEVFYRRMNSKWGSLSSKANLTLNPILRYLPDKTIEYVIFHEIAHSISRRHDKKFWSVVDSVFPDHNLIENELFAYWFLIHRANNRDIKILNNDRSGKK
jgi:predicted metal-dependent hydrolase